jgi:transmembrane sensor
MMKEMNNTDKFTDKEWEELASILSDEKGENTDLLNRFMAEDMYETKEQWKELRSMGSQKDIDVDKAWNKVYSRMKENPEKSIGGTRIHLMTTTLLRIAAIGLIIVSLGAIAIYMNNSGYLSKKITVVTGSDQKNLLVSLSDGSKIYLNRNSEFSYRSNFGKHKRDVALKGEAFFDISHDSKKPFVIDAGKAKVKVVGTSFNVITENTKSEVEVYVKTGKVILTDQTGSELLALEPGFVGKTNSKLSAKELNIDPNYLSWNTGLLVYNGQTLDIVFKDLKRVYNMDIVADDKGILEKTWTSPIESNSEDTIIQLICASFNLNYIKDGNVYHLSKK